MTNDDYLDRMRAYSEELRKDPVRLKSFLRQIMGRPHVTLQGKEKEQALLLLAMIKPFKETNNQHSWTAYYMIGDTEYHATYFPEDKNSPILDKMLPEDKDEV
jgi:hypothetical protein